MANKVIGHDLVKVYGDRFDKWDDEVEHDKVVRMLYWGDEVEIPTLSEITDPANSNVKEAYAFLVDNSGNVTKDDLR